MSVSVLINGQQTVVADQLPVGAIANLGNVFKIYNGSTWLLCNGAAVSRTAHAQLFAVIGETFGRGDGVTLFNLPTRAQAKARPVVLVTTDTNFDQFADDADIVVNNTSAAWIDIHAGAFDVGTRLSIVVQSDIGVTVYTGSTHNDQFVLLPKGTLTLEWDGSQWCDIGHTGRARVQFTANTTWKAPFAGRYKLIPIGGGGGGGGSTAQGKGGGGGGGGASVCFVDLQAGAATSIAIGPGGSGNNGGPGGQGTATTMTFGTTVVAGPGGLGGGKGVSGTPGAGGGSGPASMVVFFGDQQFFGGFAGRTGGTNGGDGGNSVWNIGVGAGGGADGLNHNGKTPTAGNYGAGGGGSSSESEVTAGGAGAAGCAFIEF